jgi:hypothetical protein
VLAVRISSYFLTVKGGEEVVLKEEKKVVL